MGIRQGQKNSASDIPGRHVGREIFLISSILIAFGMVILFSASFLYSLDLNGNPFYFLKKQFCYGIVFFVVVFLTSCFPLKFYYRASKWAVVFFMLLLGGLLIPGVGTCYNNACRWYLLPGGVHFQPAEFAKVCWTVYLASALVRRQEKLASFTDGLLFYTIWASLLAGLILLEPDFGGALLIGFIMVVMLAGAGVPWRHFLVYLLIGALVFYFFVYRVDYRWERVISTYNPWDNPRAQGYQIIQSWIAIGSGGILGHGLGQGLEKLRFLPEPFTDFILSVVGHELGFIGMSFTMLFYLAFLLALYESWKGFRMPENRLLGLGILSLFAVQILTNGAIVVGLFPTKGLPLPFLSYGGSHLVAAGVMLGLWLRMIREERIGECEWK